MSLSNKRAISTSSLGLHASHTLDSKICAAADHGFTGIEIVFADLEAYSNAKQLDMIAAAHQIRQLCSQKSLQVLSLCPFENFEGHNSPLEERLAKASRWISIARALGATYLQVPAQFDPSATGDELTIVSELQQLADLCLTASPPISIAYEPMSWSTHYSTWQSAVHLTNLVNRANFKICLDTFHTATKLWASPHSPTGKYPDADRRLTDDLRAFARDFPRDKLAYIQLSDAERLTPPFSTSHPWFREGEAPQFSWSKHGRPFPLEADLGAYLPVRQIVAAWIVDLGFGGWVSMEVFDRRMMSGDVGVGECAGRAARSWGRVGDGGGGVKSVL